MKGELYLPGGFQLKIKPDEEDTLYQMVFKNEKEKQKQQERKNNLWNSPTSFHLLFPLVSHMLPFTTWVPIR